MDFQEYKTCRIITRPENKADGKERIFVVSSYPACIQAEIRYDFEKPQMLVFFPGTSIAQEWANMPIKKQGELQGDYEERIFEKISAIQTEKKTEHYLHSFYK